VLAVGLDRGGQLQQLLLADDGCGGEPGDGRLSPGEGAGLVEEHRVDGAHPLQRQTVPDQHSGPGGTLGRDRDHQRDGQPEGMRAGHHQHGHGPGDGILDVTEQRPDRERDQPGAGGEVEQEGRGSVGQRLRPRRGRLRLGHQPLDAGQGGVLPDRTDPDPQRAVGGHGPRDHGVGLGLGDRL
jgi:hypothetical protein